MSTATKIRTTQIWMDTIAQEVCRYPRCRRTIYFAVNVRTGNRQPFDTRPVPIAEQRELETGRVKWTIDLAQTIAHHATCPGATYFRRPR